MRVLLERQIECYFGADVASFIGFYLFYSPPLHLKTPGSRQTLGTHWVFGETSLIPNFLVEILLMYSRQNVCQASLT